MKAALIGLPFSGKSTVFQALTGIESGKKEETVGTIKVPDERIDRLSEIYNPKKKTYSEFVLSDYTIPPSKESALPAKVKNMIQKSDLLITMGGYRVWLTCHRRPESRAGISYGNRHQRPF